MKTSPKWIIPVSILFLLGCQAAQPTATAVPANTPLSTATVTLNATPESLVVGNTGGDGVYIRQTPKMEDMIKAWPDGTVMIYNGKEQSSENRLWKQVEDPDGNMGWIPDEYLLPFPMPTPES